MFQACPICRGEGKLGFPSPPGGQEHTVDCPTCAGTRLLDEKTGKPPQTLHVVQGPAEDAKPEDIIAPPSPFDDLTPDEITFWSTPYFDEIQARKDAMERQRKEDEVTRG